MIFVSVQMRLSTLRRIQARADDRGRHPGSYLTACIEGMFGTRKRKPSAKPRSPQMALFDQVA